MSTYHVEIEEYEVADKVYFVEGEISEDVVDVVDGEPKYGEKVEITDVRIYSDANEDYIALSAEERADVIAAHGEAMKTALLEKAQGEWESAAEDAVERRYR